MLIVSKVLIAWSQQSPWVLDLQGMSLSRNLVWLSEPSLKVRLAELSTSGKPDGEVWALLCSLPLSPPLSLSAQPPCLPISSQT